MNNKILDLKLMKSFFLYLKNKCIILDYSRIHMTNSKILILFYMTILKLHLITYMLLLKYFLALLYIFNILFYIYQI